MNFTAKNAKKLLAWSFQSLTMKKEDTNAQSARGKK
jgi:hypothetical protein